MARPLSPSPLRRRPDRTLLAHGQHGAPPRGRRLRGALQRGHARLRRRRLAALCVRVPLRERRWAGSRLASVHQSLERLVS